MNPRRRADGGRIRQMVHPAELYGGGAVHRVGCRTRFSSVYLTRVLDILHIDDYVILILLFWNIVYSYLKSQSSYNGDKDLYANYTIRLCADFK